MKTYHRTHPWITFSFDPTSLTPQDWLLLGECRSKCDHVSGAPLPPATASKLAKIYLAKGVNSTTAIEGNTLLESQVLEHIEGKLILPRSQAYMQQEIENIRFIYNEIEEQVLTGQSMILDAGLIKEMNRRILRGISLPERIVPGEFRNFPIAVGLYRGIPYDECDYCINRLCDWLGELDVAPNEPVISAIVKAIIAHVYIAWIHPFGDGNGRTARLIEHQILIRSGIPAPSTYLLSNHYNQTRQQYYQQLDDSSVKYSELKGIGAEGANIQPFINYALRGFVDGLVEQLKLIRDYQGRTIWTNLIYNTFKDQNSKSMQRRRLLALEISKLTEKVKRSEIPNLSRKITEVYSGKTDKTIDRDVNYLQEQNLIRKEGAYISANRTQILSFLPVRASQKLLD